MSPFGFKKLPDNTPAQHATAERQLAQATRLANQLDRVAERMSNASDIVVQLRNERSCRHVDEE